MKDKDCGDSSTLLWLRVLVVMFLYHIKTILQNLIIAGVESTSITFTWIFSLLLKNPSVLEKARAEVDAVVGKERNLDESDVANLPYVQAIVKETLRLYPPAPLLIPHGSRDDCIVGGYHVSRGTRLIVNVWMIQRDPRLWSDPEKFYPERFITNNVDIKGQNFEIIPFGSGRRICPGASFALQLLQFTVARMVHAFDLSIDPVVGLDLEEGYENFLTKLNPLWIQLKPRLPEKFYASV